MPGVMQRGVPIHTHVKGAGSLLSVTEQHRYRCAAEQLSINKGFCVVSSFPMERSIEMI